MHHADFIRFVQRVQQVMAKRGPHSGVAFLVPDIVDEQNATCNFLSYQIEPTHKLIMIAELVESVSKDMPQDSDVLKLKAAVEKLFGAVTTSNVSEGLN